ncbi:hypothetical protein [Actinoallomurus sp. NPDC050550]|uniref:hypothetical protein n=1 Tax=Actinoallomurus sp. NPDC050550 TaxID=3154937 RepID=UPI0033E962CD
MSDKPIANRDRGGVPDAATPERLTTDLAALLETARIAAAQCERLTAAGSRQAELARQAAAQARARLARAEQTARELAALTAEARKITAECSTHEGSTRRSGDSPG